MNRGIKITLKDLRISKAHKVPKVRPCTMELDNYIRALDRDNPKTVLVLSKLLFECMEKHQNAPKQMSLGYHLSKYVVRKK